MGAGVEVAETSRDPSAVTSVIRHTVGAGSESRYEAWFRKIATIAETFPGHRGVDFIRPPKGSRTYTIVLHFDTNEHLERWLLSDARKRLIAEIEPYLEGGDQVEIRTGLEFWFTPPDSGQKHAKTYKQFLITWSVIFPLTIFVPWVLHPLFQTTRLKIKLISSIKSAESWAHARPHPPPLSRCSCAGRSAPPHGSLALIPRDAI
jgi:antibiotic biosynthesis monooxygenase (ABM) superfamily enzyme